MKPPVRTLAAGTLALALLAPLFAGKAVSDLVSPEARRPAVDLAQHITRPPQPEPVPADLVQPFNPAGFDQPDPEELRAAAAAAAQGMGPAPSGGGASAAPGSGAAAGANQPARPASQHDILENLAAKLPTTGTIIFNGEPLLLLARNRVKIGDKFTVTLNGQDYELELTAIDRTTFTLRYNGEEITRPIKSGKSP